jgi:hypothetical protein
MSMIRSLGIANKGPMFKLYWSNQVVLREGWPLVGNLIRILAWCRTETLASNLWVDPVREWMFGLHWYTSPRRRYPTRFDWPYGGSSAWLLDVVWPRKIDMYLLICDCCYLGVRYGICAKGCNWSGSESKSVSKSDHWVSICVVIVLPLWI